MDEDDIVDLRTGKLVQDRGVLRSREKPWTIGRLLAEGEDGEEDDDDGDGEEAGTDKDDLLLEGNSGEQRAEEDESEDELNDWDTVPAPPSPSPSPEPGQQESPIGSSSRNETTLSSLLSSSVRPKLERIAREREQSPLPSEDLEAFLAAEQKMKTEGYVEPEALEDEEEDNDEIVFLGYGQTGGETTTTSEGEGEEEGAEDSEDELNDWATVPAPPEEDDGYRTYEEDDGPSLSAEGAASLERFHVAPSSLTFHFPSKDIFVSRTYPSSDEEDILPPPKNALPPKPPGSPRKASQLPTPPSSGRSTTTNRKDSSPVRPSSPKTPRKKPSDKPEPTLKRSSATTLTPTLSRVKLSSSGDTPKTTKTRTSSRKLIPEVVVPTLKELGLESPRKRTANSPQKKLSGTSKPSRQPDPEPPRSPKKKPVELPRPPPSNHVTNAKQTSAATRKRKRLEEIEADLWWDADDAVIRTAERVGSLELRDEEDHRGHSARSPTRQTPRRPRRHGSEDYVELSDDTPAEGVGNSECHKEEEDHRRHHHARSPTRRTSRRRTPRDRSEDADDSHLLEARTPPRSSPRQEMARVQQRPKSPGRKPRSEPSHSFTNAPVGPPMTAAVQPPVIVPQNPVPPQIQVPPSHAISPCACRLSECRGQWTRRLPDTPFSLRS